jgi:hypothetical protein
MAMNLSTCVRLVLIFIVFMTAVSCREEPSLACDTLLTTPAPVTTGTGFEQVNTVIGGGTGNIEVELPYAYLSAGPTFLVLDVSDPSHPTQITSLTMPSGIGSIKKVGDVAYVSTGDGVYAVDISQPTEPVVRSCQQSFPVESMSVSNEHIYTIGAEDRFQALDITDPAVLVLAGDYEIPSPGPELRFRPRPVSIPRRDPFVMDVASVEKYAYVIEGLSTDVGGFYYTRLRVLDVSKPQRPKSIGVYQDTYGDFGNLTNLLVHGNFLYLSSRPGHRALGTAVFDLSDPAEPTRIDSILPGGLITISGEFGYFVPEWNKLQVWDMSDHRAPYPVAEIELERTPSDMAVVNDQLYLAIVEWGLQIIDIGDLASPKIVGRFGVVATNGGAAVADQKAYLTPYGAFHVVDFKNPEQLISSGLLPVNSSDVAVEGDYAYLLVAGEGLGIVDVSDSTLSVIATHPIEGFNTGQIAVSQGYAYVIRREEEVIILDVSNPLSIREVGSYARPPTRFKSIAVVNGYSYLSTADSQVLILDVSEPATPIEVRIDLDIGYASELVANDDYLFSLYLEWLKVFDISQPANPTKVSTYQLPPRSSKVAVDGDYIYIMDGSGMDVLTFTPSWPKPTK